MPEQRSSKTVAFFGYLGDGNIGNDASFETVADWLRRRHPELRILGITSNPAGFQRSYGLPATAMSLWRPEEFANRRFSQVHRLLRRLADVPRLYHLAGSVDAVCVPGMGVLEDSLPVNAWGLPLTLALMAFFCRIRRTPFLLVAVGADRARRAETRTVFRFIVRIASHVSFRDAGSAIAMGVGQGARIAPDLAFAHPSSIPSHSRAQTIALGVMGTHWTTRLPASEAAAAAARHLRETEALVEQLLAKGMDVLLVVADRSDAATAQAVSDSVRSRLPDISEARLGLCVPRSFAEMTNALADTQVVIATRFHNLVCALRLSKPVVSLGYGEKSHELMRTVGLSGLVLDVRSFSAAEVLSRVDVAEREADSLIRAIESWSGDSARAVESLLCDVDQAFIEQALQE